jgi:hypothetical protein
MAMKTFDPKEVTVVLGVSLITGFAADKSISIEIDDAQFNEDFGRGEYTRFRKYGFKAQVTLTLTQASSSNFILNSYATLDREKNAGQFPLFIKDLGRESIFTCLDAYVATVEYGNENKNRKWVIICPNPTTIIGGIE